MWNFAACTWVKKMYITSILGKSIHLFNWGSSIDNRFTLTLFACSLKSDQISFWVSRMLSLSQMFFALIVMFRMSFSAQTSQECSVCGHRLLQDVIWKWDWIKIASGFCVPQYLTTETSTLCGFLLSSLEYFGLSSSLNHTLQRHQFHNSN